MIDYRDKFKNHRRKLIGAHSVFESSVVIPIIDVNGEDCIVLQKRSSNLKHQPGEVSLPGGKVELGENPKYTAIREFCEELELGEDSIEIITEVELYMTPVRGLIHSFLAICKDVDFSLKNNEVEELFYVPVKFFIDNEPEVYTNKFTIIPDKNFPFDEMNISKKYFDRIYKNEVIFYKYNGYVIWGITAQIIKNFVSMIK